VPKGKQELNHLRRTWHVGSTAAPWDPRTPRRSHRGRCGCSAAHPSPATFIRLALILAVAAGASIGILRWWPSGDGRQGTGSSAADAPSRLMATRSARLHGVALDPEHRAAAGVIVRLYQTRDDATAGRRALARTTTSADGSFVFDGAPADHTYFLLCFIQEPSPMHAEADVPVARDVGDVDCGSIVLKAGRY